MILFGWGHQKSKKYDSALKQHCNNCNNETDWELHYISTWFTLFFIPVFSYKSEYLLLCPICSFGTKLSRQEFNDLKTTTKHNVSKLANNDKVTHNDRYLMDKINKITCKITEFTDKIFKPREITLASATVKLTPLNEKGENEEIRKMVIDYLINKYRQEKAGEIIDSSSWGVGKLIPSEDHKESNPTSDCFCVNLEAKDERYSSSFFIIDGKLSEAGERRDSI